MKVTTSSGKTYDAAFAEGPTMIAGTLMMRIRDGRTIGELAPEFEQLETIQRTDENQGDKQWTGYTKLIGIRKISNTEVQIELGKE